MQLILDLDTEKCTACGACAVACMDQNDLDLDTGIRPFRAVYDWEPGKGDSGRYLRISIACMHCEDAPCIMGCPCGCISKDPDNGMTVYDTSNCIGCHSCAMACPFGVPSFGDDGKMQKCHGCVQRIRHGMEPACVRVCPTGALRMLTREEYESGRAAGSLQKMGEPYLRAQV